MVPAPGPGSQKSNCRPCCSGVSPGQGWVIQEGGTVPAEAQGPCRGPWSCEDRGRGFRWVLGPAFTLQVCSLSHGSQKRAPPTPPPQPQHRPQPTALCLDPPTATHGPSFL